MASICEDFRIDVAHEMSFKYLQAVQYDHNSRKRRLIITDSNIPIHFKGTEYIIFSMSKNGNNYANVSCPFESDGYPYITFTESMLSEYGDIDCGIKVFDSVGSSIENKATIISPFNFKMTISKSLMNYDRLVESSEYNALNDLILQAILVRELLKDYEANKEIIDAYIIQVNNDIQSYRENYSSLSSDAQVLINDVQSFLNSSLIAEANRVEAENSRVAAENKRQADTTAKINDIEQRTSAAISDIELRTNDAIAGIESRTDAKINEVESRTATAISATNEATQNAIEATGSAITAIANANESATSAFTARDQCLAAIENLHWEIVELDGGAADTGEETYQNEYDGGGA